MLTVKCYNTSKYQNTTTYKVKDITAMPGPEEITDDDIEYADGIMLTLNLADDRTIFIPHSFLISITSEED